MARFVRPDEGWAGLEKETGWAGREAGGPAGRHGLIKVVHGPLQFKGQRAPDSWGGALHLSVCGASSSPKLVV